jgi:hypothetical protein
VKPPIDPSISAAAKVLSALGAAKGGAAIAAKMTPAKWRRLASQGGKARAKALSPERRSEIAKLARAARTLKQQKHS